MKLIKKVKAFFFHKDDPVELDLIAAEIKEGKAYLHPRGEEHTTYLVKSDDIEINLSKNKRLTAKDIIKMKPKEKDGKLGQAKEDKQGTPPESGAKGNPMIKEAHTATPIAHDELNKFKKRKFVVSLYPDEYDALLSSMKTYGYKRADFVMACVNTATKGTMEKAHRKIIRSHNEIKKAQQALLSRQQEPETVDQS